MRVSVIDIGTNTILLLVADIDNRGTLTPVHHDHAIVRLGKGVDKDRTIMPETSERVLQTLSSFLETSRKLDADRIAACGTSALRDASNRQDFLDLVRKRLGIDIRILSGDEEAELTYRGAISEFLGGKGTRRFAVLDIGGGSTELSWGVGLNVRSKRSMDIGCVRLTERTLTNSPPTPFEMSAMLNEIGAHLAELPFLPSSTRLIGVAGTLTTLAALDLNLPEYDPKIVSGHGLRMNKILTLFNQLRFKSSEELKIFPQILPGREDVLVAGIAILIEVMRYFRREEITVSDRGLRYGVAMMEARKENT